jgi:hypothetical protein
LEPLSTLPSMIHGMHILLKIAMETLFPFRCLFYSGDPKVFKTRFAFLINLFGRLCCAGYGWGLHTMQVLTG